MAQKRQSTIHSFFNRTRNCFIEKLLLIFALNQGRPTRGPRKSFEWPAQCFLELSVTMILILVQKVANRRLISGEDLFFLLDIIIILVQKVGCFLCMARQYFLCVKMALGSKRLNTPALNNRYQFSPQASAALDS